MFIWGSAGDVIRLGQEDPHNCPVCEKTRTFSLILSYQYQHAYYVFGFVSEKQYALVCDVCKQGTTVDASLIEPRLGGSPIPFMHRFGCLVLVGIVVAIAAITSLTRF